MDLYLVEFACTPADPVELYLIDDRRLDNWVVGEPQIGYHHFKIVRKDDISMLLVEQPNLLDFFIDNRGSRYVSPTPPTHSGNTGSAVADAELVYPSAPTATSTASANAMS